MNSAYFKYANAMTGIERWEDALTKAELSINRDPDWIKTCKRKLNECRRDAKFWGRKVCY